MKDVLGIFFSILCLLHCFTVPMLTITSLVSLPFLEDEIFHLGMLFLVFLVSGPVLVFSNVKLSRQLGIAGLTILIFGLLSPEGWIEKTVTLLGCGVVILAHIRRLQSESVQQKLIA